MYQIIYFLFLAFELDDLSEDNYDVLLLFQKSRSWPRLMIYLLPTIFTNSFRLSSQEKNNIFLLFPTRFLSMAYVVLLLFWFLCFSFVSWYSRIDVELYYKRINFLRFLIPPLTRSPFIRIQCNAVEIFSNNQLHTRCINFKFFDGLRGFLLRAVESNTLA